MVVRFTKGRLSQFRYLLHFGAGLEQFLAALDGLVRLLQDRRRVDGEPVLTLEYGW